MLSLLPRMAALAPPRACSSSFSSSSSPQRCAPVVALQQRQQVHLLDVTAAHLARISLIGAASVATDAEAATTTVPCLRDALAGDNWAASKAGAALMRWSVADNPDPHSGGSVHHAVERHGGSNTANGSGGLHHDHGGGVSESTALVQQSDGWGRAGAGDQKAAGEHAAKTRRRKRPRSTETSEEVERCALPSSATGASK